MEDLIYYYTKDTFKRVLYGEIQSDFNMSFVIDGTKDSAKIQVISFNETEIEPYTIVWHKNTNTWWVVSHDKVERSMNESGFIYVHNVELLGAIELFNARDLTDCGFNQNDYNVEQFIERLLDLSNLEFANNPNITININSPYLSMDILVDYMKTFENYTLLSALREFLEGYNCDVELTFGDNLFGKYYFINSLTLNIIPKTGNTDTPIISENLFKDIRETRTIDKNSFGTTVVSNAENVISTKAKTFPSAGSIRLSGSQYEIEPNNAFLRLPSNIFKVNWLKMYIPTRVHIGLSGGHSSDSVVYANNKFALDTFINNLIELAYENYVARVQPASANLPIVYQTIKNAINNDRETILRPIILAGCITLYSGWTVNPVATTQPTTSAIVPPTNNANFYQPQVSKFRVGETTYTRGLLVGEQTDRETLQHPNQCYYYEKGKNIITGFDLFGPIGSATDYLTLTSYYWTDLRDSSYDIIQSGGDIGYYYYYSRTITSYNQSVEIEIALGVMPHLDTSNTSYKVNYIPMSNLKVKYDNSGNRQDTQLYNQNGKLTDSNALSKLLLSYSKEIETDNITKYANFYSFSSVPKVGDICNIGNKQYVINNVSLDIHQNEEDSGEAYFIEGEFTMSRKIGVKSLMTNPNTNIRDYGIPQNNNVVRKQLYRDFYELGYTIDSQANEEWYLPLNKIVNVGDTYREYQEHIAVMKLGYNDLVQNSEYWYYQLDTTSYILKKQIYEVINFNDNNIIGYCSQNVNSEFDITRVFNGWVDNINTPISYTDENGNVKSFNIAFCSNEQLTSIYDNYRLANGGINYGKSLYNYSIFIPSEIYEGGTNGSSTLYEGVIGTGDISNMSFEITDYLGNYSGEPGALSIGSIVVYDFFDSVVSTSKYSYSFIKSGNRYYIYFTMSDPSDPSYTYATATIQNINRTGYFGAKENCDFEIKENNYKKDALEVPFFEYGCQIDDGDDVIVGDNILDNVEDDICYLYTYTTRPTGKTNNNSYGVGGGNVSLYTNEDGNFYPNEITKNRFNIQDPISMSISENEIRIKAYSNLGRYDPQTRTMTYFGSEINPNDYIYGDTDLVIYRYTIKMSDKISGDSSYATLDEIHKDLMFVLIKPVDKVVIEGNEVVIKINHYKIK